MEAKREGEAQPETRRNAGPWNGLVCFPSRTHEGIMLAEPRCENGGGARLVPPRIGATVGVGE